MSLTNPHQSPAFSLPSFRQKQLNTGTWGTGGNTLVINDPYIFKNSVVHVYVTGTVPAAGRWAITVNQGSATVTSSDPESSTLTIGYIVL